jgi:hypothetical protein
MMPIDSKSRAVLGLLALLWAAPAFAQSTMSVESLQPEYLEPFPTTVSTGPAPRMLFELAAEISLPGPLPGSAPRLVRGEIEIEVSGGVAQSAWDPETVIRLVPADDPASAGAGEPGPGQAAGLDETEWSVSPDGRYRATVLPSGHVLAQKKCRRCVKGWQKKWKLRVPGRAIAPPLVTDKRVFYGAMNNRVYGVKRKNGHRVWEADVEGRASRHIVVWPPPAVGSTIGAVTLDPTRSIELVMIVPDSGDRLLALDARTGSRVAEFELEEDEGTLVGGALITPDGKVVVARQKYSPADASLMVFDLAEAPEAPEVTAPAKSEVPGPAAGSVGSVL